MSIDWDSAVLAPLMDVFGEEEKIDYRPFNRPSFSVNGIFDDAYEGVELAGGLAINSSLPVLGVRLAEFPVAPEQDDTLRIARTREIYTVKKVQPDSHGGAKLSLQFLKND